MSPSFFHHLLTVTPRRLQDIFLALVLVPTVCLLVVQRIFRPPHRRTPPKGKQWALPPGPAGVPVVGNLRQFQNARYDEVAFTTYVGSMHLFKTGPSLIP